MLRHKYLSFYDDSIVSNDSQVDFGGTFGAIHLNVQVFDSGRATLSGGGFIIEFDKVESVCFGKSFRPLVVS